MTTIFLYELKNRKRSFLFLPVGVLWLWSAFLLMKQFPQGVISITQIINRHTWLQALLGITETIESVTYETVITAALVPFIILSVYKTITDIGNAIGREPRLGTYTYFRSLPVSGNRLLLVKFIISLIILILELLIWGILIRYMCLYNCPDHEFFYEPIKEHVTQIMTAFCHISFLGLCIGFCAGCITRTDRTGSFAQTLMYLGILTAILPNIIQCCISVLEEKGYQLLSLTAISDKLAQLRFYNPIYLANPTVITGLQVPAYMPLVDILLCSFFLILGVVIYHYRNQTQ